MAGNVGRADAIKKNGVVIAGIRNKNIAWSGEPIDETSGEDNGIRKLLAEFGQQQLSISGDGLFKDDAVFRALALTPGTSKLFTDITYEFANGDEISGDVLLTSYDTGSPYNDATTFSFSLEYADEWTFTAAP